MLTIVINHGHRRLTESIQPLTNDHFRIILALFQRAATLAVSWGDSGILTPDQWAGKRIGAWPFGNELEVIATATMAGLTEG